MSDLTNPDWWFFCYSPMLLFSSALVIGWHRWTSKDSLKRLSPMFLFLFLGGLIRFTDNSEYSFLYFSIAYFSACWLFIANRDYPAIAIFALGGVLNSLAALFNNGKMPVIDETTVTFLHQPMTADTKIWWLCDWIVSHLEFFVLSPGDLLLILGSALFFTRELLIWLKNRRAIKI